MATCRTASPWARITPGQATFVLQSISMDPAAPNSLFLNGGTSIVVHAKADDQKTDPSGDSGNRIACGVIKP